MLTVASISISVFLLLGIDMLRHQAKNSFSSTVSGTDLIVGARGGQINLLLYSVFHIGNPTNNLSWKSYQAISQHRDVKWSIPLSLGDSHRGYRVLGTSEAFFQYYQYGNSYPLEFSSGRVFSNVFDLVLGAEVAQKLGYQLGDEVVIAHGMGNAAIQTHDDKPFRVVGVLKPTGTPVDRTLHVSLAGIEAIHLDWKAGVRLPGATLSQQAVQEMDLTPKQITAFMLGLKSRLSTFHLQRSINRYRHEPLTAILPGLALQELWQMFSIAEQLLVVITGLVVVSSLIGMLTLLLTSLNERRREMSILRSLGARPHQIVQLLLFESLLITLVSILVGVILFYLAILGLSPLVQSELAITIGVQNLTLWQWQILGGILLCGTLMGVIPGYKAYRQSLLDGMSLRI